MPGLDNSIIMTGSNDKVFLRETMASSPTTVMVLPFEDNSSTDDFGLTGDLSSSPSGNNNSSSTLATLGADPKQANGENTAQNKGNEDDAASASDNSRTSSIIPLSWLSIFDRCFADCGASAEPKEYPYNNTKEEGDVSAFFQVPEDKISDNVPKIIRAIKEGPPKPKVAALNDLYNLTQRESAENRVPLVCTADWNVIPVLASVLVSDLADRDKKLICLSLVNLTVPIENKACLTLGANADVLLDSFWQVIFNLKPNANFCCACLMNLSFLEDAKDILLHYIPTAERSDEIVERENQNELQRTTPCLNNPKSLLRALETMFITYQQYCQEQQCSFEREAIRWGIGFLQQMTDCPARAAIIGQTQIPRIVFELLRDTNRPIHAWKEQSLEDMGLLMLLDFAKNPESCSNLWTDETCAHCLDHMVGKGGIHEVRAAAVASRFEVGSIV